MRKTRAVLGTLATLGATATLIVAATVPAGAVGPFTVKVGTKTSGSYGITGTSTGAAPQIKLSSGDVNMSCASGTATGRITAGQKSTGTGIATITASTWTTCKGPLNLNMTVTQTGTWRLDATSLPTSGGTTKGKIVNIKARVSTANPSQCSFDVTGTVKGDFTAKPTTAQKLTVSSPSTTALTIQNVTGCFGLLANGDLAQFTAVYAITTAQGPITITSP